MEIGGHLLSRARCSSPCWEVAEAALVVLKPARSNPENAQARGYFQAWAYKSYCCSAFVCLLW